MEYINADKKVKEMKKMFILVTGASASGKSEYAEKRIMSLTPPNENAIYIATMQPFGDEGKARVEKHKKQRAGRRFDTLEIYRDLDSAERLNFADGQRKNILLECMSNLVANEMFDDSKPLAEKTNEAVKNKILSGVQHLIKKSENLVIVTNEVFSDTMDYDSENLRYIELLGSINQSLVRYADEVVEVVYGVPVFLKTRYDNAENTDVY